MKRKEDVTINCPLAHYMQRLSPDGRIFEVSVTRAAQVLGIKEHSVRSELASLQRQDIIRYTAAGPGVMTVRFL